MLVKSTFASPDCRDPFIVSTEHNFQNSLAYLVSFQPKARNTTVSARKTTVSARNTTVSARNTTVSVRNTTVSVRNTTVSARNTTVSARNTTISAGVDMRRGWRRERQGLEEEEGWKEEEGMGGGVGWEGETTGGIQSPDLFSWVGMVD